MQCIITKYDQSLRFHAFYSLETECFPSEPYNEIQFNEIVQGDFWTARVNGILAGFCNATTHKDRIHLHRLEVNSQYRKAGIGGLLIDKVTDFAKMNKFPCVTLTVRTNNEPAYHLYLKKALKFMVIKIDMRFLFIICLTLHLLILFKLEKGKIIP